MRFVEDFYDYELIDATDGQRLERWRDIILIRPDPQVIWHTPKTNPLWSVAHAVYHRSAKGGGYWETRKKVPAAWSVDYQDLTFRLKPMGFKHTGLFPEQAVNWKLCSELIQNAGRPIKVLNLFAYTGAATVACLQAGAAVTHVDAAQGMVQWAKENAVASGVADASVRWLVDDCVKFVRREIRRGNRYDAVIMDPPSYGRGPNGELWRLEEQIEQLLQLVAQVLSDEPLFFLLNSYTAGLSPTILNYLVQREIVKSKNSEVTTEEIGLQITEKQIIMPCGNTTLWIK
ncbi:MAG: class I SAM-dependent methyltransferase [Clostridia bacterium]|nr:class I SAM-dependent methyltransferase [Clostridia bacterium]MBQ7289055.1 class I SAM-dependent methyltransferase [Clostridia bacterium]